MQPNKDTVHNFIKLLESKYSSEQSYQDYLEQHTSLFYPPFELNHSIHFNLLISKFRLDTSLTADFAYLTKSSAVWWLVLVEIEHPDKRLFRNNGVPSSDLTAAISQVNDWRSFVERNESEVHRKIAPLKKPLERNKIKYRYALVIGRTKEFEGSQKKLDALESLQKDDFKILTYDSFISAYNSRLKHPLDVVSQKGQKFSFKYSHRKDTSVFSWLSPNEIHLSTESTAYYKSLGYDIDQWKDGELLAVNRRKTNDHAIAVIGAAINPSRKSIAKRSKEGGA